jgi:toxin ParE1/3/4
LAEYDSDAAQRAAAAIDTAVRSLAAFPQRGRPSGIAGVREFIVPFGQSAYVVRYAYMAARDEIVILRIWHGREARE